MIKKPLHYIKVILAAIMLCSAFFAYAEEPIREEKTTIIYQDQKEIILEKAEDDNKTIGELKENIKELNKEKAEIDSQIDELKQSSDLGSFFRDDLNSTEIITIKNIIAQYKEVNVKINQQLLETAEEFRSTVEIKSELLEERKNLYKSLVPYIKIEKLEEYKQYITGDANYLIEKKKVDEDIVRKEEVIEQKVEKIEEKIEQNQKALEEKLKTAVAQRVDAYLIKLKRKPKFMKLSKESKILVIDSLILRLEKKIEQIKEKSLNSTATIQQKIEILESVVLEKFRDFKQSIQ